MATVFRFPEHDALLDDLALLTDHNNQLSQQSGHLFASLKATNRAAAALVRLTKQQTAQARLAMDQAHLHLQNLLYERRHLEREIEKCNRFASVTHFHNFFPGSLKYFRTAQSTRMSRSIPWTITDSLCQQNLAPMIS